MPLEDLVGSNKYIADLVKEWPLGIDPLAEGDDHIRGVKNVLVNTFGEYAGPTIDTEALMQRSRSADSNEVDKGAQPLPYGTEANRPASPVQGYFRYNSDAGRFEIYRSGSWDTPIAQTDITETFTQAVNVEGNLTLLSEGRLNTDDFNAGGTFAAPLSWRLGGGGQLRVGFRGYGYGNNQDNHLDVEVRDSGGIKVTSQFDIQGIEVGSNRVWNSRWQSGALSFSNGQATTVAHDLNETPGQIEAFFVCDVAEDGYQPGDRVAFPGAGTWQLDTPSGGGFQYHYGATISWNDSQINIAIGSNAVRVVHKNGGSTVQLTPANWHIEVTAWAMGHTFTQSAE